MTQLYRISWRSLLTGFQHTGENMFTSLEIEEIVETLNKRHKDVIFHWVDPNLV